MARDPDRNAYHTVGLPKDSVAYQRLVQEAAESNISVPSLIALRVADWYRLTASGTLALASGQGSGVSAPEAEREEQATQQAQANAEAAAAAWLDD